MSPVAVITGASAGIGKAAAVAFAQAGYDVGITWHSEEGGAKQTAEEVAAEGRRAEIRHLDLTDLTSGPPVIEELIRALGGVDAFVNNAGGGVSTPFLEHPLDEWQQVIDLNLTGAFLCAQAAARHMVGSDKPGRIINVTSVHEHVPLRGSSAYCAAKGGLGLLTKVMALELAEHDITVNAVAPGEIATKMTGKEDRDPQEFNKEWIPAGRPGHAREIADAIVFLASPQASYITGQSIVVDGGLTLMSAIANQEG